jgi:histidine phosphotransferase ChpT
MGLSDVNLAGLIGSRICHDLISPIGAINNGLELLGMSGMTPGPELDLISQSVGSASARIRYFRIAFGASGDQMVGRAEVASILRDLYANGRLDVVWGPLDPQQRALVRLAFLGVMCVETGMPYGGRIEIVRDHDDWQIIGHADKVNIVHSLWEILATGAVPPDLQPAHVQFALLPQIAADAGRRVSFEADEPRLTLTF